MARYLVKHRDHLILSLLQHADLSATDVHLNLLNIKFVAFLQAIGQGSATRCPATYIERLLWPPASKYLLPSLRDCIQSKSAHNTRAVTAHNITKFCCSFVLLGDEQFIPILK